MDYACIDYNAEYEDCEVIETGFNDQGNHLMYLDRHNIECPAGKAMTSYDGYSRWGSQIRFATRCCRARALMPTHRPTHHPVADPTHQPTHHPVAHPTHKPVADPTHSPTDKPVADPTHRPTDYPVAEPSHRPTREPTHRPISDPTHRPTDHPVADPTHQPTHHPVAHPTHMPVADPTHSPTDKPTINTEALLCSVTVDQSQAYYKKNLPKGCVLIALDDLKTHHGSSKGIVICGNKKLDKEKLESWSLIQADNVKGQSISYFAAGEDAKIKYFLGDKYSGAYKTFYPKSPDIVSVKIGGLGLVNDRIHSLEVSTNAFDGIDVPTKCPFQKHDEKKHDHISEAEVKEVFHELSKGEDFITKKELLEWKDIKELISLKVVSADTVDEWIHHLKLPANGHITLNSFHKFITMLDKEMFHEE